MFFPVLVRSHLAHSLTELQSCCEPGVSLAWSCESWLSAAPGEGSCYHRVYCKTLVFSLCPVQGLVELIPGAPECLCIKGRGYNVWFPFSGNYFSILSIYRLINRSVYQSKKAGCCWSYSPLFLSSERNSPQKESYLAWK